MNAYLLTNRQTKEDHFFRKGFQKNRMKKERKKERNPKNINKRTEA